jgi:hypothetical protein
MLQLMMGGNSHHHRMGQYYNYTVDNRLAEKAGYKDAKDYFSKHLADLSQSSLTMYGAVAKASASRWPAASASRACTCC